MEDVKRGERKRGNRDVILELDCIFVYYIFFLEWYGSFVLILFVRLLIIKEKIGLIVCGWVGFVRFKNL